MGAFRIDPSVEAKQVERLNSLKKERNSDRVKKSLQNIREVAGGDENLVPPVLEAVRAYATVGEICDTLREVFGEYEKREYFSSR